MLPQLLAPDARAPIDAVIFSELGRRNAETV